MIVTQIRRRGIRSPRVLLAFDRTPREWFVPEGLAADAYLDAPLPIANAQTISQPYVVALMTAALALHRQHRVLEVGTGSGYQTAILAHLVQDVFTVERFSDLLVTAEERLHRMGITNVHTRIADGAAGWPEAAPFDGIMVTAAAARVPRPLIDQLAPGGRMVIPVGGRDEQDLMIYERTPEGVIERRGSRVRFVPLVSPLAGSDTP